MNYKDLVPERFRARYDRLSDRWLILDTWHEQIQNIADLTQDLPDTHPAIKIISGGEVNALIGELKKINKFGAQEIIKETSKSVIIDNEYISNSSIADTLEKIAGNLRGRKNKKIQR